MNATWAEQLRQCVQRLQSHASKADDDNYLLPLSRLQSAAESAGEAWSRSSLGYHSRVYYKDLIPPPPGAHFSVEWGFQTAFSNPTRGDWKEFAPDDVITHIEHRADNPDLSAISTDAAAARKTFESEKAEIASILHAFLSYMPDEYIAEQKKELDNESPITELGAKRAQIETGPVATRDQRVNPTFQSAPHQDIIARTVSLRAAFVSCDEISQIAERSARHIDRLTSTPQVRTQVGTKVFIGHGRSPLWRDLKDFIQDRIGLPYDEFNRVPIAGVTNIERLIRMLDDAAIAFLVLTAEDELADESFIARLNVVHEAGLFQGRLGFARAIVILEEGCGEFSNIQGLGQIRFPRGNITAVFEEIRRVLEREKLV